MKRYDLKFLIMEINDFKKVINGLPNEFDSHEFIKNYIKCYEPEYVKMLSPEFGTFKRAHAQIGKFLSDEQKTLGIKKNGTILSEDIKGDPDQIASWKKI